LEKGKWKMGSENRPQRVTDFTELETWQVARRLRTEVYTITRGFPPEEKYCLSSQMRRAAVSVTANVAEGYGRFPYQENIQFLRQSRASAYELRDHLTTALDAGYITKVRFAELDELAKSVVRLLNGYIRSTKARREAAKLKT
jgi:four helix bundle protein